MPLTASTVRPEGSPRWCWTACCRVLDGTAVCRHVRELGNRVPILFLTARDSVEDRVSGLDAGADDYLTKPFSFEELSARIRALLRRPSDGVPVVLRAGVALDPARREVIAGNRPVSLTAKEFGLLELLLRHPGQVLEPGPDRPPRCGAGTSRRTAMCWKST